VKRSRAGPGIVKTRGLPLQVSRSFELIQTNDYRIRELFEQADVISEGAVRQEALGPCYYGTTSVLLPTLSHGGLIPDDQRASFARQLRADPHARVRAVRIACREAQVRSRAVMGLLRAEVQVVEDQTGVRFDIDVEAMLGEGQKSASG